MSVHTYVLYQLLTAGWCFRWSLPINSDTITSLWLTEYTYYIVYISLNASLNTFFGGYLCAPFKNHLLYAYLSHSIWWIWLLYTNIPYNYHSSNPIMSNDDKPQQLTIDSHIIDCSRPISENVFHAEDDQQVPVAAKRIYANNAT